MGGNDISALFLNLLSNDEQFMLEFGSHPDLELSNWLILNGYCEVCHSKEILLERLGSPEERIHVQYQDKKVCLLIKKFSIGNSRFKCTEVFFDSSLATKQCNNLAQSAYLSIMTNIDFDKRGLLLDKIILTGEFANIQGIYLL